MKAILEFNLPEENEEHLTAVNGSNYKNVLYEFDQKLRNINKYGDKEFENLNTEDLIDKLRSLLSELAYENNVKIYD